MTGCSCSRDGLISHDCVRDAVADWLQGPGLRHASCAVLMLSMLVMPDLVCADSVRSCELVRDEFEHVCCIM